MVSRNPQQPHTTRRFRSYDPELEGPRSVPTPSDERRRDGKIQTRQATGAGFAVPMTGPTVHPCRPVSVRSSSRRRDNAAHRRRGANHRHWSAASTLRTRKARWCPRLADDCTTAWAPFAAMVAAVVPRPRRAPSFRARRRGPSIEYDTSQVSNVLHGVTNFIGPTPL